MTSPKVYSICACSASLCSFLSLQPFPTLENNWCPLHWSVSCTPALCWHSPVGHNFVVTPLIAMSLIHTVYALIVYRYSTCFMELFVSLIVVLCILFYMLINFRRGETLFLNLVQQQWIHDVTGICLLRPPYSVHKPTSILLEG